MPKDVRDQAGPNDRTATPLEDLYSPQYLRDCSGEDARQERLAELKRRIEARAYQIDVDRIAEELILRGEL